MFQIKITSKKREKMSEHAEKALKHMGKLMQCIEELGEDDDMDERYGSGRYGSGGGSMGERYPMGGKMNGRDDWEEDDDERTPQMGERRRRLSNGRYA